MAESIGSGLEEQIENAKQFLPDLKIVVIDTLQQIRESTDLSYSSDYKELSILKNLADKLGIAILLVHHTRKNYASDPFNMISGTTGLSGCVLVGLAAKNNTVIISGIAFNCLISSRILACSASFC